MCDDNAASAGALLRPALATESLSTNLRLHQVKPTSLQIQACCPVILLMEKTLTAQTHRGIARLRSWTERGAVRWERTGSENLNGVLVVDHALMGPIRFRASARQ